MNLQKRKEEWIYYEPISELNITHKMISNNSTSLETEIVLNLPD